MKSDHIITLGFLVGLMAAAACCQATAADAPAADAIHLAAAPADNDDDEEDEEEEAVDYRDRVREIQQWMNRRDSERKGDAPSLNAAPIAPPPAQFPKYFRDNGYDENGYRKLDEDVRVRLRDAPADSGSDIPRHYRHHAWHQRWSRHVHPRIHFRRHGYAYHYSRHSHSEVGSRHHHAHGVHADGPHAGHAHSRYEGRHAKAASPRSAVKAHASGGRAGHSKPAAKSAKKGRSRR